MAELRLTALASDVRAAYAAADSLARHRQRSLPKRGQDGWLPIAALRADALLDLITHARRTGNTPDEQPDQQPDQQADPATVTETGVSRSSRTSADVLITIDLPTALGLADNPAHLDGYGPIPANLARTLAADGHWRRLIHDPHTGALLDLGSTRYQPSTALRDFIRARDRTCCGPFCRRPAHRSDLDHTNPYHPDPAVGGGTDRNNLGPACTPHHQLKHKSGWTLHRDPDTASATWTTPTGHTYTREPYDYRPTPAEPEQPESFFDQPDLPEPPDQEPDPYEEPNPYEEPDPDSDEESATA